MIIFFYVLCFLFFISVIGHLDALSICFSILLGAQMICLSLTDLLRKL